MDIHVIGLDVDDEAREQLQQFAAVAGGNYHDAHSEADLDDALADINDSVVQTALALASTMETPTEEPPTVTDTAVPETPTPSPSPHGRTANSHFHDHAADCRSNRVANRNIRAPYRPSIPQGHGRSGQDNRQCHI
jgi:hypothetical protein